MIVKDINGAKLSLTQTRLVEIEQESTHDDFYQAKLRDIARAESEVYISIAKHAEDSQLSPDDKNGFHASFNLEGRNNIGCRDFTKETFDKIVAHAKRMTAPKRKAAKLKAKTAAAGSRRSR